MPNDEHTLSVQRRMLKAPHLISSLHVVAKNEEGFSSYCGCWYDKRTDYVCIEPVCTKPNYRNLGIGKSLILEALKRSYTMGAKKAYVISDNTFYKNIGFKEHSNYHFYWIGPK